MRHSKSEIIGHRVVGEAQYSFASAYVQFTFTEAEGAEGGSSVLLDFTSFLTFLTKLELFGFSLLVETVDRRL